MVTKVNKVNVKGKHETMHTGNVETLARSLHVTSTINVLPNISLSRSVQAGSDKLLHNVCKSKGPLPSVLYSLRLQGRRWVVELFWPGSAGGGRTLNGDVANPIDRTRPK